MTALVFRFRLGHYHATPWDSHVNEGQVEWPPSPWRIVRALLATGFSKLSWTEVPTAGRQLVEELSRTAPAYLLPSAIASHTRHFVPTDNPNPEAKTKLFDALLRIDRDAPLAVIWPGTLSTPAWDLFAELGANISYLGRAESVVDAFATTDPRHIDGHRVTLEDVNAPGLEPVSLLAPMPAQQYDEWKNEARKRIRKDGKGDPIPRSVLDAVMVDVEFLQRHRWTQPPGSRWLRYWRPPLETAPRRIQLKSPAAVVADTALYALASETIRDVLPHVRRSLPIAERVHDALRSLLGDEPSPELVGRDAQGPLRNHKHATVVPLDLDEDQKIDHVLVHAPMGFGTRAQAVLRQLMCIRGKGLRTPLLATLVGIGSVSDVACVGHLAIPHLARSSVWVSATPFVPSRHLKKRYAIEDQIRQELEWHGRPVPARVEVLNHAIALKRGFHHHVRARSKPHPQPPTRDFFAVRLTFEHSISGPLSLGYGSHFGLGLFVSA